MWKRVWEEKNGVLEYRKSLLSFFLAARAVSREGGDVEKIGGRRAGLGAAVRSFFLAGDVLLVGTKAGELLR